MNLYEYADKTISEILNAMKEWDTADFVEAHNAMCETNDMMDDYIYGMYMFDEMMEGRSPSEIAQMIQGVTFNTYHPYFWFHNGKVKSGNYFAYGENLSKYSDLPIYPEDIAYAISDY